MPFVLCLCLSFGTVDPPDRWFAEDKLKHFAASFAITTIGASGARMAGLDAGEAAYAGAAAGGMFGIWKEVRDARSPGGNASVPDLVWDAAGVAAGTVLMLRAR